MFWWWCKVYYHHSKKLKISTTRWPPLIKCGFNYWFSSKMLVWVFCWPSLPIWLWVMSYLSIRIKILTFYTHNPPYLDQNQDHSYFIIEHLLISKEDYLFLNISHQHQFGENTAPSHHKRLYVFIVTVCLSIGIIQFCAAPIFLPCCQK